VDFALKKLERNKSPGVVKVSGEIYVILYYIIIVHRVRKKVHPTFPNTDDFQHSFTDRLDSKFAMK